MCPVTRFVQSSFLNVLRYFLSFSFTSSNTIGYCTAVSAARRVYGRTVVDYNYSNNVTLLCIFIYSKSASLRRVRLCVCVNFFFFFFANVCNYLADDDCEICIHPATPPSPFPFYFWQENFEKFTGRQIIRGLSWKLKYFHLYGPFSNAEGCV